MLLQTSGEACATLSTFTLMLKHPKINSVLILRLLYYSHFAYHFRGLSTPTSVLDISIDPLPYFTLSLL